jgi:hypothetical protein
MNRATEATIQGTTIQLGEAHMQSVDTPRPPWWEGLPSDRHHELVMVSSTMVVKRLSAQQEEEAEVSDE